MTNLFVFDLDFTLWTCGGLWIDCTQWPFRRDPQDNRIFDAAGAEFRLYPDVPEILDEVHQEDCLTAVASRTSEPAWAEWVLREWDLWDRFDFLEIYPGSKTAHFQSIRDSSGVDFADMLFFDDEERNITDVGALGVASVLVRNGLDRQTFAHGCATHGAPERGDPHDTKR